MPKSVQDYKLDISKNNLKYKDDAFKSYFCFAGIWGAHKQ